MLFLMYTFPLTNRIYQLKYLFKLQLKMKCTVCSRVIMPQSNMSINRSGVDTLGTESRMFSWTSRSDKSPSTHTECNIYGLYNRSSPEVWRVSSLVTLWCHVCCFSMMLSKKFPPTVISDVHWSGLQLSVTQST